ncbi:MAG: hypothetical protein CMJ77_24720 [Planctomycetaceae bacterium]|nr:hypothetical protein [Planctomycetaceae bacterium]
MWSAVPWTLDTISSRLIVSPARFAGFSRWKYRNRTTTRLGLSFFLTIWTISVVLSDLGFIVPTACAVAYNEPNLSLVRRCVEASSLIQSGHFAPTIKRTEIQNWVKDRRVSNHVLCDDH